MEIDEQPVLMFIDASSFEQQNYAFRGERIGGIVELCVDEKLRLIIPDVSCDEIKRRIRKQAAESQRVMKHAIKDSRFLGHDRELVKKIRDRHFKNIGESVVDDFDEFLKKSNASIISVDDIRASDVLAKYFAVEPPFSIGEKEKEFPDAFAIEALLHYAAKNDQSVFVVSDDKDFAKACETNPELIHVPTIEAAIEVGLKTSFDMIDECHEALHDNLQSIIDEAKDRINKVQFSLNAVSGQINRVKFLDFDVENEAVVSLNEQKAFMALTISASVNFDVDYATEAEPYYDADDRLIIPYEDVSRELHVYLLFPVQVTFDIQLRKLVELKGVMLDIAEDVEITLDDDMEFEIQPV